MTPTPEDLQVQFPGKLMQIEAFQADMLRGCGAPPPFRPTVDRITDACIRFTTRYNREPELVFMSADERRALYRECERDFIAPHDGADGFRGMLIVITEKPGIMVGLAELANE